MGAVKNAIQRDELDPSIMDLDHNKSVVSQLKKEEEVDTGPPLKDDPKVCSDYLSKYAHIFLYSPVLISCFGV